MYTTAGLRGHKVDTCGHEHETHDEAQRCLVVHQQEMRKAGKMSVRQIVDADTLTDMYDSLSY
jgi:hypothetical protein